MPERTSSSCRICGSEGRHDFTGRDLMFGGTRPFEYHRCSGCGLIYQHPLPDSDEIAGFYPESYSVYRDPERTTFDRRELAALKRRSGYHHLEVPPSRSRCRPGRSRSVSDVPPWVPGGKALDVGCGNGEYALRLKSIGWQCRGVEFNPLAASICRAHGLDVFQGELQAAGFEDDSFDFVSAHHLIEHARDPNDLMREIARIVKPGGRVLIRTPNSESLGRRWFGRWWYANDVPRHLFLFSERNLALLAARFGLEPLFSRKPVKAKLLLRSLDYRWGSSGRPAKKRPALKWLSRAYVPLARTVGGGDELFMMLEKR